MHCFYLFCKDRSGNLASPRSDAIAPIFLEVLLIESGFNEAVRVAHRMETMFVISIIAFFFIA